MASSEYEFKTLEEAKNEYKRIIEQRLNDKILEETNADYLKKWIDRSESFTEAASIFALGNYYKRTGFFYDVKLEKFSQDIAYFSRNTNLSFESKIVGGGILSGTL